MTGATRPDRPEHDASDAHASEGGAVLLAPARRDILDVLATLPPQDRDAGLSALAIGERLGLHRTTVRFHLDRLIAAGLVASHLERTPGAGRPGRHYTLAAPGPAVDPRDEGSWAHLAGLLTAAWTAGEEDAGRPTPESLGARWVRDNLPADPTASGMDLLLGVLHHWGFTSDVVGTDTDGTTRVDIVRCPFVDLAREHRDVVCGIHRGLLTAAVAAERRPGSTVTLTPFAAPGRCTSLLTPLPVPTPGG